MEYMSGDNDGTWLFKVVTNNSWLINSPNNIKNIVMYRLR